MNRCSPWTSWVLTFCVLAFMVTGCAGVSGRAGAPAPEGPLSPGLSDPAARFELKLRLRRQLVQQTRDVDPVHLRQRLWPTVERRLRQMGLDDQDVAELLADVERAHSWR